MNPSRKRARASIACDSCQRRKSKCEDVSPVGCHRCRSLGTDCSLAMGAEGDSTPFNGSMDSTDDQSRGILHSLDSRTMRIENLLRRMSTMSAAPARWHKSTGKIGWRNTHGQIATGVEMYGHHKLEDPIRLGLATMEELDTSWKRLAMLSPGIIPLPLSGTPPSHPFLRTVVLAFDGIDTSTPLGQLLSQSLNMIHSAPPDDQIVLALLILASSITQRIGETVDAWDGAKRALSYGRSMAYEDVPFLITAHSSIMLHPGMLELRTRAAIWYATLHRNAWSEIWNSPSMITSTSNPMPIHEIFTAAMLPFTHLVLESQLLSLWRPVASALQEARLAAMMGSLDANPLTIAIDKFVQELAIWRLSLGQTSVSSQQYLLAISYVIQLVGTFRVQSESVPKMPTLLGVEAYLIDVQIWGNRLISLCHEVIDQFITFGSIPRLPSFELMVCFMPYAVIVQQSKLRREDHSPKLIRDAVYKYRELLVETHPQAESALSTLEGHPAPREWDRAFDGLPRLDETTPESLFDGVYDWMDLFAFDPMNPLPILT